MFSTTLLCIMAINTKVIANETDYIPAMRQELARLAIEETCDLKKQTCYFTHKNANKEISFDVSVSYDNPSKTIYISIDRFLILEDSTGPSKALGNRSSIKRREYLLETAKNKIANLSNKLGNCLIIVYCFNCTRAERLLFKGQIIAPYIYILHISFTNNNILIFSHCSRESCCPPHQ